MIPVLYPSTQLTYTTNGIGRLVDAISCIVTEELNGIFELEMEYPVNGKYYPQIQNGGIIGVVYNGKLQPFDINKITVDETGICKVNASHVSNRTAFAWIGGGRNYRTLDQMIYTLNASGQVPYASNFVPGIPQGLDAIIQKAMQKDPKLRYKSIREMVTELDALMVDPNGSYGIVDANSVETPKEPLDATGVSPVIRQEPNYGKLKDIERSIKTRRRSRWKDNLIVAVVVVLIIGILIGLTYLVTDTLKKSVKQETQSVFVVQDYVGKKISEVQQNFTEHGFTTYKIEYEVRSDYAEDVVIKQNIQPGMEMKNNSSVNVLVLTVSKAPKDVELEDYYGQQYWKIYEKLKVDGYVVRTRPEINNDVDEGIVLRTDPPAGTPVKPNSEITIIFSEKSSESEVPDIIKMDLETARTTIDETGLVLSSVEMSPELQAQNLSEKDLFVMLTDPAPGTKVQRKSAIRIYVGNAEDVARGGTPTPTPEVIGFNVHLVASGQGSVGGEGVYAPNSAVTISAVPSIGYQFVAWVD